MVQQGMDNPGISVFSSVAVTAFLPPGHREAFGNVLFISSQLSETISKLCSCSHFVQGSLGSRSNSVSRLRLGSTGPLGTRQALADSLIERVSPEHAPVSGGTTFHHCPATAPLSSLSSTLFRQVLLF